MAPRLQVEVKAQRGDVVAWVLRQLAESELEAGGVAAEHLSPGSPPHPGHQRDTRSEFAGHNWIWMGWIQLDLTWQAARPGWHWAAEDRVSGKDSGPGRLT